MAAQNIKYWYNFAQNIICINYLDAVILEDFLSQGKTSGDIFDSFEILDFQRYRKIRKRRIIASFHQLTPSEGRFLFLVNKN